MQPEVDSVRASHRRFYELVSTQNLLGMEEVWSHAQIGRAHV